jgi:hypothetical protein
VVVIVVGVIVVMSGMIMSGMRVESGRCWRRGWLRVTVGWIDVSVWVSRVIVAE